MQIFGEMREWNQQLEEKHCPSGASDFSYWVITNLPVSDKQKLELFSMNSAIQRLREELHLLQKVSSFLVLALNPAASFRIYQLLEYGAKLIDGSLRLF